jgi:two-component system nitrogen regulation sensor histidine kinase NtrY
MLAGARRPSWITLLAIAVAPITILSLLITGAVIIGFSPLHVTDNTVAGLELLDIVLGLTLVALVAARWLQLWSERRKGTAGARLHFRLILLFSIVAVVPAVVVAVYAAVTLNVGIDTWFSKPVRAALDDGKYFADRYVSEQAQGIIYDAGAIAETLQLDRSLRDSNGHMDTQRLFVKLADITKARNLPGSFLVDSRGNLLGSATRLQYSDQIKPSATDLAQAAQGQVVVDGDKHTGVIRALVHLPVFNDANLLVVRVVDPRIFAFYTRQKAALSQYRLFESERGQLELTFAWLYVVGTIVLLLAAIWLGLWAANRIVDPVSRLIGAAERVSKGDLKATVVVDRAEDEIAKLSVAFNRMVSQLDAQHTALVDANRQNAERRRFTEAVLAGVSAGVLGLDADGRVTIVNRTAAQLLNVAPEEIEGRHFSVAVPEFAGLIQRAISEPVGRAGGEIAIQRSSGTRALSVQVASEQGGESGHVVTFDDITDLVSAQRTAAWADVARRIAHEIKNPLTPIQLSAERLKRKYAKEVATDKDVFEQCTDTIIRQVGDIGRMVDEFSSFARMPTPVMRREIAQELVQQAVFLQRVAHPQISFETHAPKVPVTFEGDGRLLAQALTNVLKNAAESIATRLANGGADEPGRISVSVDAEESFVVFRIADNGLGLPSEHRHRLTEPYVTTRAKGTGLGLAIVRKILEDHQGELTLADLGAGQHGAEVTLKLPRARRQTKGKSDDEQTRIAYRG